MSLHPVVACGIHPCLAVDPTPSIHCTAWPALCIADPAAFTALTEQAKAALQ